MSFIFDYLHKNCILALCEQAIERKSYSLNLARYSIKNVPDCILECDFLLKLYLNHNSIEKLPSLNNFKRIQVLTLDFNCLKEFPESICNLTNLRFLNISCNKIETIPSNISELKFLDSFWCNKTGLLSIPPELCCCQKLRTFGARGNSIEHLPENIGNLKNLTWLTLESNKLSCLPKSFGSLHRLVHINLRHNQFKRIPRCFRRLRRVRFAFLNFNLINKLPALEDLYNLNFMKILNISDNPICDDANTKPILMTFKNIVYTTDYEKSESEDEAKDVSNGSTDWNNSVHTSEIDSTDESTPVPPMEDVSTLLPEMSRFVTNFS